MQAGRTFVRQIEKNTHSSYCTNTHHFIFRTRDGASAQGSHSDSILSFLLEKEDKHTDNIKGNESERERKQIQEEKMNTCCRQTNTVALKQPRFTNLTGVDKTIRQEQLGKHLLLSLEHMVDVYTMFTSSSFSWCLSLGLSVRVVSTQQYTYQYCSLVISVTTGYSLSTKILLMWVFLRVCTSVFMRGYGCMGKNS